MGSLAKMLSQTGSIKVRSATLVFGLILLLLKISLAIWALSFTQSNQPIPDVFASLFGYFLIFWGLVDVLLLFGTVKGNKLIIQIWIASNLVVIGLVFAIFGIWQMTVCMIFFAIALSFGMEMIKKIEEESNNYNNIIN